MKISKLLSLAALALAVPSMVQAQDLMAREAKADFQLKSSNVVKIINQAKAHEEASYAKNIYGNHWNNDGVNVYKGMAKPEELVINLKDFSMPIKSRVVTSKYGYRPRFRRVHYGLETVYGHLSKQLVNVNQEVKSGQPIGLCGNTGHSFGSHLHFETRVLGEAIDPALMFDIAAADVVADTYTYRSSGNHKAPAATVAEPVLAQAKSAQETAVVQPKAEKQAAKRTAAHSSKDKKHKVQKGETLYSIARKHNTTVAEICKRNRIKESSTLRLGQSLTVK